MTCTITEPYSYELCKSSNENMRIKNLELNFGVDDNYIRKDKYYPTIYIDGGYIQRFEIGSVHNRMEYLPPDYLVNYPVVNQFEVADFVTLEIVKEANQSGNAYFASTFEYIAHSGCGVKRISFDLIDMDSQDPERETKHYDLYVDCKPAPNDEIEDDYDLEYDPDDDIIRQSNLNQKVGIDSLGNLYLVISEKYDLTDVFNRDFSDTDTPDVIEYDDKFERYYTPLLAILNPNKLRILRFDNNERRNLTIQIDRATIKLSDSAMKELGPYLIASALLNAINCGLSFQYELDESLYRDNTIDINDKVIQFNPQNRYNQNSLDMIFDLCHFRSREVVWPDTNITEFIPELIAEINDELDFWSESNEEHKEVLVHLMNRMMELLENKIGLH